MQGCNERQGAASAQFEDASLLLSGHDAAVRARLLGFATYIWTIPAQIVQIHFAISATEASRRVGRMRHPGVILIVCL